MRKMYGLPEVVILPEDEVSTSIGTLYSMSFGITASVQRRAPGAHHHRHLVLARSASRRWRPPRSGLDLLSSTTSWIFRPSTPPAALICVLGDLRALRDVVARGGEGAGQRLRHADLDRLLRERRSRTSKDRSKSLRGSSNTGSS